ncbi:MAG: pilus assembly protein CpaE [Rhodobacteraceae bacterium]|uniref:Pilus assembly protein CpaE n=1 Tax=Thioclava marina TaxID=1915077 RepID=A0ABX3MKR6_9RHOB|nr:MULTISPECIES: AAA family ATPase [Thioclava]OOY12156.1 pilus assembly protein CpaE [Thioclava marina]OOY27655.1 pilus assembly protein CpaE [Thioclava sp. L04-15]TNE85204.1 MAG: pilus assembly protein CpaE [Paracoccaceae bacterium]TNF11438.1 MAG: pilus assembly protein CpaE [Paracoccaceae bacterium]
MSAAAMMTTEPAPIQACTVSRDVSNFDLLIEDMETELGESWGDLTFDEAVIFLGQPDASKLEFIAIAVDGEDEDELTKISGIITEAKERNIRVILIAEEVSPIALHQLLRLGADDFVPYPLPEGALHDAIERLGQAAVPDLPVRSHAPVMTNTGGRDGVVLAVHGLSGGVGATTFAVNLAWELATAHDGKKKETRPSPRVCLLDLDLQFGSTATYLDLPRRELIYELLSDTEHMDGESFKQALLSFNDKVDVLTAPADMLPLDLISGEDVERLIDMARSHFDFVVIDMPSTVVSWTETVLNKAQLYFGLLEMDMRSAQNVLRLVRALKAEGLPTEKLRYVLNRAPKFTDLNGKARVKRLAESLDISIELMMSDGGKLITQANDHGLPLALSSPKIPLRKEIQKLAGSLVELGESIEVAA